MTEGMREDSARRAAPIPALSDPDRLRSLAETRLGAAPDEAFDRFARLVADLLDVPVALVSLVTADRQFFPGETGLPEPWAGRRETPLSHSFCQHVVDIAVPMVLPDARLYPRVRDNLAVPDLGVVAYAGMPLTDLDGRVLGSLCAIDNKPRAWTAEQLRTLADLAAACSSELRLRIALQGAEQARQRSEEAHQRLDLLAGLSETLAGTLDVDTALRRLGDTMVPLLADWCLVSLVGSNGSPRDVVSAHRDPTRARDVTRFAELMGTRLGPQSITRAVLRTGRPVLGSAATLADVRRGTIGAEMSEIAARLGFASHLSVPITDAGRGRVLGCITLVNGAQRRPFDDGDMITALDIGRRAGQAIANSWMYGEQRHVAHVLQHSMLPQLPTTDDLELAARYQPAADRVEVGGDWYDAFVQPGGDVIAAIGDVAGHDIEAAATMGQLRNLVRGNAYGRPDAVGELMTHLDGAMRGLRIPVAATATLVRLRADPAGGQWVTWCNAGHPPPLVVRAAGAVQVLDGTPEPLLGLARAVRRTSRETHLAAGDTLLLYTDGLVERRDRSMDESMAELVERLGGTYRLGLDEFCDLLLTAADSREDDIALLAVRAR
ncbi:SpoIIE family protein phosphatase [Micromonospora phytophila]|uniref:SpoIIE family protein phosphatase n=1 Tax=Micromonospora phytophila TaxID=709888 RepID=UPI0020303A9B|nr:SpoIIE family protein phosphatase [Micromonospora phytophila]MCM0676276.1 SpoIIE family protein phosphatase [Micromonospora phytophila]